MKKTDDFLDRIITSYKTIAAIGFLALVAAIIIPWVIPYKDIGEALKALAQINVTVAIGLGTLVIAFKAETKIKVLWTKRIMVLLITSVLCFLLSFVSSGLIQVISMMLSGVMLVSIIISSVRYIKEHIDGN